VPLVKTKDAASLLAAVGIRWREKVGSSISGRVSRNLDGGASFGGRVSKDLDGLQKKNLQMRGILRGTETCDQQE
jgi:hypothetical protein